MTFSRDKLIEELRSDEGEVLHAYEDHLGFITIGVGRMIDKRKGGGISREESAYLLSNDIARIEAELDRRIPWWRNLSDNRQRVLVNMAFQLGVAGLMGFRNTLALIEAGEYVNASRGMLNSLWARQTPERAKRLSERMRLG